jgi:hypothetical protein
VEKTCLGDHFSSQERVFSGSQQLHMWTCVLWWIWGPHHSGYEELECVFDKFAKYHMKILSDFNAKVGKKDLFKPIIGNGSLHQISSTNGVRVINFTTSKNHTIKIVLFPHHNIHKFTWTFLIEIRSTIFW